MNGTPIPLGEPRRTSRAGLLVHALDSLGRLALPIVAALIATGGFGGFGLLLLPVLVLPAALSLAFHYLAWERRTFTLGEEDIRVESGILSRQARSVPYERIQDVSLEQKPLPRLFGLVEVRFETGAGGKDELKLAYVTRTEGETLRRLLRELREGTAEVGPAGAEAGPVEQPAEAESQPIFAMGNRRIFTFGLFEFSLAVFAVLLGLAQQFDFLLPASIWQWETWRDLAVEEGSEANSLGQRIGAISEVAQAIAMTLGLAGLVLIGLATGLVRTFAREYGFRLDRTPRGFRRRRGLFTVTDVVMPAHRVQAAEIGTKWLRYRFGWHWLEFVSLAQDSKSASHRVAPFAQLEEIWPIIREAGLEPPPVGAVWHKQSLRAWSDSALIVVVPLVLAAMAVIVLADHPVFALAPLVFAVLAAFGHWYGWKFHAHALDRGQIYLRSGFLSPQMKLARQVKLQSVEIVQGPLARRRGYAALKFGLAGGSLAIDRLDLAEARRLRDAVLESVCSVDFSRLPQSAR